MFSDGGPPMPYNHAPQRFGVDFGNAFSLARRLAVPAWKRCPRGNAILSRQKLLLDRFDKADHLLAFYGGKTFQKIIDRFAAFQKLHQVLDSDALAGEDRLDPQTFTLAIQNPSTLTLN